MKTTRQRLQQYRQEAATGKWVRPLTWRDTKQHHPSIWAVPNSARGKKGEVFTDSIDQYGRDLGPVGKMYPRMFDHTGWYADNWHDALISGHVCRMRCPRGTLYIPATRDTECDGTVHYLADAELVPKGATEEDHDEACREAARSADHYAEREAEEAREYDARSLARGAAFTPAVCGALRDRVSTCLAVRADQFEIIKAREENYWAAAPWY